MKKIILVILLASSVSFGQQYRKGAMESWYKDVIKARVMTLISDSISAMSGDARDSLTVNHVVRFGGLSNYNARASVKNDAVKATILQLTNSRNTVVANVDSSGRATVVGLTTTGAITATSQSLAIGNITATGDVHASGTVNFYGEKTIGFGDSITVSAGGRIADTSAFSTTLASKAIYIPGALSSDAYFITKRVVHGTSTVMPADSCLLSYMAKPDSLIVLRQPGTTADGQLPSGTKFSWFRIKLQ